jgi:hypothetical protein
MSSNASDKRLGKAMRVSTPDSRSEAAIKAWATRLSASYRAAKSERASKIALSEWCQENGWKVVFFESATGSPRTGIVDALIVRIKPREPDAIEVRLVQLKSGVGGLTGAEITRLKRSAQ